MSAESDDAVVCCSPAAEINNNSDDRTVSTLVFLTSPASAVVTEGEDALFECQLLAPAAGDVVISWYKDDELIPADDDDFKQSYDGHTVRLFISGTYLDDAATYRCQAALDTVQTSTEATLTVTEETSSCSSSSDTESDETFHCITPLQLSSPQLADHSSMCADHSADLCSHQNDSTNDVVLTSQAMTDGLLASDMTHQLTQNDVDNNCSMNVSTTEGLSDIVIADSATTTTTTTTASNNNTDSAVSSCSHSIDALLVRSLSDTESNNCAQRTRTQLASETAVATTTTTTTTPTLATTTTTTTTPACRTATTAVYPSVAHSTCAGVTPVCPAVAATFTDEHTAADVDCTDDIACITDDKTLRLLLAGTDDITRRQLIRRRLRTLRENKLAEIDARCRQKELAQEDAVLRRLQLAEQQKQHKMDEFRRQAHDDLRFRVTAGLQTGSGQQLQDGLIRSCERSLVRAESLRDNVSTRSTGGLSRSESLDHHRVASPVVSKPRTVYSCLGSSNRNQFSAVHRPNLIAAAKQPGLSSSSPRHVPVQRSASTIKQMLLDWCRSKVKNYKNVDISNFSTSWTDGLAFCALIHHFRPDAFNFDDLDADNRRHNFQLAFDTAEHYAGIVPLLEVDDMVRMSVPDWKCVFTYVQSFYQRFAVPPKPLPRYDDN